MHYLFDIAFIFRILTVRYIMIRGRRFEFLWRHEPVVISKLYIFLSMMTILAQRFPLWAIDVVVRFPVESIWERGFSILVLIWMLPIFRCFSTHYTDLSLVWYLIGYTPILYNQLGIMALMLCHVVIIIYCIFCNIK